MDSHNSDDVTPQSQKRTSRGLTVMKKVICVRSKNIKLSVEWNAMGQPLNIKGGNTLVSYIGVVDYMLKSFGKAHRKFRTNAEKYARDANRKISLKPPTKYANITDEAHWKAFITRRTEDESFLVKSCSFYV
ncbi:hypothetical protein Lal_00027909 [Lupinus albus]|nr:hypothetical protein Lal_00027909 [Lupinus albus]